MLPLSTRLSDICAKSKIPRHILEKDYVLSWVLAGISEVNALQNHLIFKGGTCLKKCYFGDYRFSEDLDFSTVGNCPTGLLLESFMKEAAAIANAKLSSAIGNIEITCNRYKEKMPHPKGQEAFVMNTRLPYQREPLVRVLVEVTTNEKVLDSVQKRPILHSYGEKIEASICTYSLNEIIAEKICAILSSAKKIHEKTWHRSRSRDYYDLWRILSDFNHEVRKETLGQLIQRKTLLKGIIFSSPQDLFELDHIQEIKRTWDEWLGPLLPNLPTSETVLSDLKELLDKTL